MILGIDTSASQCAVAVVGPDGTVVARRVERMQRGHAEALMPMIDAALDEANATHRDLARIGVCTGPGSFTGIRVGVAAARGLALGLGVPASGVDRFRAIVRSWRWLPDGDEDAALSARLAVALSGPQGTAYFRTLDGIGRPCSPAAEARQVAGDALPGLLPPGFRAGGDAWPGAAEEDGLPDPASIASDLLAGALIANPPGPAKPFYLREAGAAPAREAPPPILDP